VTLLIVSPLVPFTSTPVLSKPSLELRGFNVGLSQMNFPHSPAVLCLFAEADNGH
jgi:hypothetical protein